MLLIVISDCSRVAISAVTEGKEHLIAFASGFTTSFVQNYAATEGEI